MSRVHLSTRYVALDYDAEAAAFREAPEAPLRVSLPDGTAVELAHERFRGPGMLLQPHAHGPKSDKHVGWADHAYAAIAQCFIMFGKKEFYANIVLAGGSTLWPGVAARLTKELKAMAPSTMKVHVSATAGREHSAWIGGLFLAMRPTSRDWISKAEYDESGPGIVHRRCA